MPIRAKVCQDANSRNLWVREDILVEDEFISCSHVTEDVVETEDDFMPEVITNTFSDTLEIEDAYTTSIERHLEETGKSSACLNTFVMNTEPINSGTKRVFGNQVNVEDSFSGNLH